MQSTFISQTITSPEVYYSSFLNKIEIKGRSITLEGDTFWPKLEEIKTDLKPQRENFQLHIDLETVNTAGVRNLAKFIHELKEQLGQSIQVKWFYSLLDLDLLDTAQCIEKATGTSFEFIGKTVSLN